MPPYDPPPAPPGVSADARYTADVYAHGTRAILTDAERRHLELIGAVRRRREQSPGPGGWLAARLATLPQAVQTSLALAAAWLVLQLGGAAYERLVGRPPPQATVPTVVTAPIPVLDAMAVESPRPSSAPTATP